MKYLLLTGSLLCSMLLTGCGSGASDTRTETERNKDEFDVAAMLQNLADNVIIPGYQALQEETEKLVSDQGSLAAYCDAIGSESESIQLENAREQWRDLMAAFQSTELFLLGPASNNGNNLRNRIYSFGTNNVSSCGIDRAIIANESSGFSVATAANSSRGIDALEYLLFNEDLTHTCPSLIQDTQNWDSLPELSRKQQRCSYAQALAGDLHTSASSIVNAWAADQGGYRTVFLNSLNVSRSLEDVSNALFFVDKELKDLKVGGPLGRLNCATPRVGCSEVTGVESPLSDNSLNNLDNNLQSFLSVFSGNNGLSFDDLIVDAGFPELVDEFEASVTNARNSVASVTGNFAEQAALINTPEAIEACETIIRDPIFASNYPICNLFGELKTISDLLRTKFIMATNLNIPDRAQSDND